MNFFELITRQEPIAGLEVNESYLRLALLSTNKRKSKTELKSIAEVALPVGVIVNGAIQKKQELTDAMKSLVKKFGSGATYVILTLPPTNTFYQTFIFPTVIDDEKLQESMDLRLQFQIPWPNEQAYTDWERVAKTKKPITVFGAMQKQSIDEYVAVVEQVGLRPIAAETHPMSLARIMNGEEGKTYLVHHPADSGSLFFVVKNKTLRFSRYVPMQFLAEADKEIANIRHFYEAEYEPIEKVVTTTDPTFSNISRRHAEWQVCLGAAFRGIIPRSSDTIISFLPVGTEQEFEETYKLQIAQFFSTLTIGFSLLLLVLFGASLMLISDLEAESKAQLTVAQSIKIPESATQDETRARAFSELIIAGKTTLSTIPRWSTFLKDFQIRITPGIIVRAMQLSGPQEKLTIEGTAKTRPELNAFKKSLEESPLLAEVTLPLENIEQIQDIPFQISFKIKDQQTLFNSTYERNQQSATIQQTTNPDEEI